MYKVDGIELGLYSIRGERFHNMSVEKMRMQVE